MGPQAVLETYRAAMMVNKEQRPCIVKWLRADRIPAGSYQTVAKRFVAAGRRLLDRHDPSWTVVFDVGENEHGVFLIRDFVVGVDLHGLLKAARENNQTATLNPVVATLLASKLAHVLAKAHRADPPLHHLGLGPANVLVTTEGEVVVADFGLFASVRGLLESGPDRWAFVAPEWIGADRDDLPSTAGVAADLYALGGLLFYLLAGRPPVEARSLTELSERAWEPLPALPGVPSPINTAIAVLTAPDPQSRCKSMEEAVAHLTTAWQALAPEPSTNIEQSTTDVLPFLPASQRKSAPRPPRIGKAFTQSGVRRPRLSRLPTAVAGLAGLLLLAAGGLALRSFSLHVHRGETPTAGGVLSAETTPQGLDDQGAGIAPPVVSWRRRKQMLVPGRLGVSTIPTNADLWVDGVWQGKTPLDVAVGPGAHRVVIIAPGHLIFKGVYDTTEGEIIRRALDPIDPPTRGQAHMTIECQTKDRFPILIDGLETGLLCPTTMIPVVPGRRSIAIFIPVLGDSVAQEVAVRSGSEPILVRFPQ